jgi:LPPG:FO 2-phospho-L-lactate transferase
MALGFATELPAGCLTVIVNTADDEDFHGLRVCPDLDTVMYTLSDQVNEQQAWGVTGDTTRALNVLKRLGADATWMTLGDADIGLHLHRSARLRAGCSLTQVTCEISASFGISAKVIPVSDAAIRTTVCSTSGRIYRFQEWFVANRGEPHVADLQFEGAAEAPITAEASRAIHEADLVVFAPSNPYLSILPILKVRGVLACLRSSAAVKVAVSPLINGLAVKGPLVRLMADLRMKAGNVGITGFYRGLVDGLVIHTSDAADRGEVVAKGIRALVTETRIPDRESAKKLASDIVSWYSTLRPEFGGAR